MSPSVALWVLAWIAIVVLYLALSAVLREVRLLRAQVSRLNGMAATSGGGDNPRLPADLLAGRPGIVLSADSLCPLCRVVAETVSQRADRLERPVTLLTHEPVESWTDVPPGLRLVQDLDAWREVSHLSPPVLMNVAADGRVTDLVLPSNQNDADAAITRWSVEGVRHDA